jgi:hypothetical protein
VDWLVTGVFLDSDLGNYIGESSELETYGLIISFITMFVGYEKAGILVLHISSRWSLAED